MEDTREFMESAAGSVLGLFPSFDNIGGVEAIGRLAWETLSSTQGNHRLFCYGRNSGPMKGRNSGHVYHADSKPGAILTAIRGRWPARMILIWHLGLLKLLPFLRLRDTKVALFLHGIEAWHIQGRWAHRLLRRVDLFLSNSEHTWHQFVSFNPDFAGARHRVVHLGLGGASMQSIPRPSDPPAVVMIGRILPREDYKGHKEMLAAWPLVVARNPKAQLWIAGPGPLRAELESKVKALCLQKSVRIYGPVTESEKQDLLERSRCLALPSRGEGFGLVYLEAMRMGRPCLVSNVDAGREVVNPPEAGLAVNPDDLREVADATCRLLSAGTAWEQWSQRARRRYEEQFTAERFQSRLLAALGELNP